MLSIVGPNFEHYFLLFMFQPILFFCGPITDLNWIYLIGELLIYKLKYKNPRHNRYFRKKTIFKQNGTKQTLLAIE